MLSTKHRLVDKIIHLGSKKDIEVATDILVENRDIEESVKNIFRDSVITSAMMLIQKNNEDVNLASRVDVSGFSDTSSSVRVTSDNTVIFNLDTNVLSGIANLGSATGMYTVQIKYTLLNETILSPRMGLTIK